MVHTLCIVFETGPVDELEEKHSSYNMQLDKKRKSLQKVGKPGSLDYKHMVVVRYAVVVNDVSCWTIVEYHRGKGVFNNGPASRIVDPDYSLRTYVYVDRSAVRMCVCIEHASMLGDLVI